MIDALEVLRFERGGERREFEKGSFEVVEIGGLTVGRATYEPRWKWSEHVGPGDLFAVPPGHDSWVVGDEPYVSLHFLGADTYARK